MILLIHAAKLRISLHSFSISNSFFQLPYNLKNIKPKLDLVFLIKRNTLLLSSSTFR